MVVVSIAILCFPGFGGGWYSEDGVLPQNDGMSLCVFLVQLEGCDFREYTMFGLICVDLPFWGFPYFETDPKP